MDFTVKYDVGFMSGMWHDVEAVKVESSKLTIISRASQLKYISKGVKGW